MKRHILIYGVCGGLLIILLQLVEYRFLVLSYSLEIYGAVIAAIFATVEIWLGLKLTKTEHVVVVKEVPVQAPGTFTLNEAKSAPTGRLPKPVDPLVLPTPPPPKTAQTQPWPLGHDLGPCPPAPTRRQRSFRP